MIKEATPSAKIAGPLHTRDPQENLVKVPSSADQHAHDEGEIMHELVDAVTTGDKDAVFVLAKRLVDGTRLRLANTQTGPKTSG